MHWMFSSFWQRIGFIIIRIKTWGDTRVRTRDLSICSRMLYHWAISPITVAHLFSYINKNQPSRFITQIFTFSITAVMAEWLRRWTRNPMGYSRAGSNPARSDWFWTFRWSNSSRRDNNRSRKKCVLLWVVCVRLIWQTISFLILSNKYLASHS